MGYQIEYHMQTMKIIKTGGRKNILHLIGFFCLLFIGLIGLHFGGAYLESMLLGKGHEVSTAAEQMAREIENGASFREAIQTFCYEVSQ